MLEVHERERRSQLQMLFRYIYIYIRKHLLKIDDRSALEIAVANGMTVGKNANFQDGVIYDPSHSWLITIGDDVTIAPRVHILCHDASTKRALGYTKIGHVTIGNNVFVGANTTILPNVTIGDNCVIGANSVVTHDIPSGSVAVGNPCRVIKAYEAYISENQRALAHLPRFHEEYLIGNITEEKKKEMLEVLKNSEGFIV